MDSICEICRITSKDDADYKEHLKLEHAEVVSPQAKKRKRDVQNENINEKDEAALDDDLQLQVLEVQCWEEARLDHREIEIQVNEDELKQMDDFNAEKRELEIKEKLKGRDMEKKNYEKL